MTLDLFKKLKKSRFWGKIDVIEVVMIQLTKFFPFKISNYKEFIINK